MRAAGIIMLELMSVSFARGECAIQPTPLHMTFGDFNCDGHVDMVALGNFYYVMLNGCRR
jgi:hypothetical protein